MAASKFFRPGITKVLVLPLVASYDDITAAALATAENISCQVAEMSGWSFKNEAIETPDMCSTFVSRIPGLDKAENSSLKFYELRDESSPAAANPLRTLFAKGEQVTVVIFSAGFAGATAAAGDVFDAFNAQSAGTPKEWSMSDAAAWSADFTFPTAPVIDQVLAA